VNINKFCNMTKLAFNHFVIFPVFLYGISIAISVLVYHGDGESIELFSRLFSFVVCAYVAISLIGAALISGWQLGRRHSLGKCQGI